MTFGNSNLFLHSSDPNDYKYVYTATEGGRHSLHFVTIFPSTEETIQLSSDFFNNKTIQITPQSLPSLAALNFTPNAASLRAITGRDVKMTFSIPNGISGGAPYNIRIFTEKLENPVTSNGSTCTPIEGGGFLYTTQSTGVQTIDFKTSFANSDEIVRIDGDRMASTSFSRSASTAPFVYNIEYAFYKDTRRIWDGAALLHVRLAEYNRILTAGTYNYWADNGTRYIIIWGTKNLIPKATDGTLPENVYNNAYGWGYKYSFSKDQGSGPNDPYMFSMWFNAQNENLTTEQVWLEVEGYQPTRVYSTLNSN